MIQPSYFRQGIGSRLLAAVEAYNPGRQTLVVSTAAQNRPAIGLYEKYGYRIVRHQLLPDNLALVHLQKQRQASDT